MDPQNKKLPVTVRETRIDLMRTSARMLLGAIEGSACGEGSLPCCDAQSRRRFDIQAMSKLSIHLPMANDPLHSRSCNDVSIPRNITHGNLLNRTQGGKGDA